MYLTFLFLKSFSLKRFINIIKLYLSYCLSIVIKKAVIWGKPYAISVEPINICNLKCPECPTGIDLLKRPKGKISNLNFKNILNEIGNQLWYINLYFQGEPYLHPDLFKLIKTAKQKNIIVETSTNAQFLTVENAEKTVLSGLDFIVISIDGITQEIYEKYRIGGYLNNVIEGINNLVAAKEKYKSSKPYIIGQFLAFNHNEHQIEEFKNIAKKLKINKTSIKTAQIYNFTNKANILPTKQSLSRYKADNKGKVTIKGTLKERCFKQWSSNVITWDGNVVPCCFDKDAKYNMGNIYNNNFSDIYNNKKYYNFRNKILKHQKSIDICRNCPISRNIY